MKNTFSTVNIHGELNDSGHPVLLIANHISWWDGIWALYVNERIFNRKFHFMMLEEQLRKHWYFQYTGGYSVRKNSRSIIETIEYSAELLNDPSNLVLMFPQGNIKSMYHSSFIFEKGIEKILNRTSKPVQIIFMASFIDYLSSPKPALFLYVSEYRNNNNGHGMEKSYNSFYHDCLKIQSQKEE